ncbi:hypothetical protein LCGC14_2576990, partial [marine sediment metagenome]
DLLARGELPDADFIAYRLPQIVTTLDVYLAFEAALRERDE